MSLTSRSPKLAASLLVTFAFLAGIVTGILGDHLFILHRMHMMRPHAPHFMAEHLARRLDLNDAQRDQIEAILTKHHEAIRGIQEAARPRVRAEFDAANVEIERVLTPEQREKFRKLPIRLMMPRRGEGPPPPL